MKFTEIWYEDASQQKNAKKLFFLDFGPFLPFFNKKTAKKKENRQNPNCLMKFSEIWYVDAAQQKNDTKFLFLDFGIFWPFFNQKIAKKK